MEFESRGRLFLIGACLFAVALLVRVGWAMAVPHPPPDGDERVYLLLSANLAQHARYSLQPQGPLDDHYGPALPVVSSLLVRVGLEPQTAVRSISMLAGSLLSPFLFWLAWRFWKSLAAALLAALLAAFHPWGVVWSRLCYPEMLSSLFLVLTFLALLSRRNAGLLCGLFLGLACLTRREAVLLVPVVLLLIRLRAGTSPSAAPVRNQIFLCLAAVAVVFGPYLLYLKVVTGSWTLTGDGHFAFILGRIMEKAPAKPIPLEAIHEMEARYPTIFSYIIAQPFSTLGGLAGTALFHLRAAIFGRAAGIGILACLVFLALIAKRKLSGPEVLFLIAPFTLILAWSVAGPFWRYSGSLSPFVCLWLGGTFRLTRPVPATALAGVRASSGE